MGVEDASDDGQRNQHFPDDFTHNEEMKFNNVQRLSRAGPILTLNPDLLGDTRGFYSKCVLGYLVDYRDFYAYAINRAIEATWTTRSIVIVFKMEDLFIFYYADEIDKVDTLRRGVASLYGGLMVFGEWRPEMIPRSVRFIITNLWVRVCGLPIEYINEEVGGVIGRMMGRPFWVEPMGIVPIHDFIRIRVSVLLDEPLMPGCFLACEDGILLWIQFKYEEVCKYCVKCGKIGHKVKRCTTTTNQVTTKVDTVLGRAVRNDFVIFQTESNHSIFNLDLRATPRQVDYATSRVQFVNGNLRAFFESLPEDRL